MPRPYPDNGVLIGQGAAMEPKGTAAGAADTVFRVPTAGGEPGFGTIAYAAIQSVSAASRLLGRGSAAGAGAVQELTVGTGLSISGTVVSATVAVKFSLLAGSGTVVIGATTTYLGIAQGTQAEARFLPGIAGTVVALYSVAGGVAGVGESFTYTLNKDASDTAITHAVTGGAAVGGFSTGSVAVAVDSQLAVKLTTTAGVGIVRHTCTVVITVT